MQGGVSADRPSPFLATEVAHLFPTCVWLHRLSGAAELNRRLQAALTPLRAEPSRAKGAGTWQSRGDLHRQPGFEALAKAALTAGRGVCSFLRWRYEGLEITNLWANVNFDDYGHHYHHHPNNHLSGVYYLEAAPGAGDILFYDPRPQAHVMEPDVEAFTPATSGKHRYTAEPGLMLLFPSWLEHSVEPNQSGRERISLAFNLTLRGRIGRESGEVIL